VIDAQNIDVAYPFRCADDLTPEQRYLIRPDNSRGWRKNDSTTRAQIKPSSINKTLFSVPLSLSERRKKCSQSTHFSSRFCLGLRDLLRVDSSSSFEKSIEPEGVTRANNRRLQSARYSSPGWQSAGSSWIEKSDISSFPFCATERVDTIRILVEDTSWAILIALVRIALPATETEIAIFKRTRDRRSLRMIKRSRVS